MSETNIEEYRKRLKAYRKSGGRTKGRMIVGPGGAKRRGWAIGNPLRHLPWSWVILLAALAIALKSFVILRIGEPQVERRLSRMDDSQISTQIGVFIMKPGPVSRQLGAWAKPLIGGRK